MINIKNLIKPISSKKPVGKNLRENITADSLYYQVKDARNKARQIERKMQTGSNDGEDLPRWDTVMNLCNDILIKHSKDLEIAVWLVESLVREAGCAGLKTGFDLLYQLIDKYWDNIYPAPDEEGIQTRIMPLVWLNGEDAEGILTQPIRNIAITEGSSTGPFSLWQYQQALANAKVTDNKLKEKKSQQGEVLIENIQQALAESTPEFYTKLRTDVAATIESFTKLNKLLDEKCGKLAPPTSQIMADLETFANHINFLLEDAPFTVAKVEPAKAEAAVDTPSIASTPIDNMPSENKVFDRNQALQQLQKIAAFFKDTEPHSPIPYMLVRAVKWGSMPFPELLKELINDEKARKNAFELAGLDHG